MADHQPVQPGIGEMFARYAAHVMDRYAGGANARVRGGHVVHAVRAEQWIGELRVPAPACHVGIGSWDLGVLEPTAEPVTCARCAHLAGQDEPLPAQLALW